MRPALSLWVIYVGAILAANWMIHHIGTCIPDGPCVIPVGGGYDAPSGVLMIGLALICRDGLHEAFGRRWVLAGIAVGALLSAGISPSLAVASGIAFGISELADFGVYEPLRRYSRIAAVAISGTIGGAVDSALFLYLAFGSLDFFTGQFIGKTEMALAGAGLILIYKLVRRDLSIR